MNKKRVAVLISGRGSNMVALIEAAKAPDYPAEIVLVVSNVPDATGLARARQDGIATAVIDHRPFGKDREAIIVTELPYQVNKARLIEFAAGLVNEKKLEGISNIRDESDRDGMRIVFELKRDEQAEVVLNNLYKHTQMQITFGVIMLAIVNQQPKEMGLIEVLKRFLEHRADVIRRRTDYLLRKSRELGVNYWHSKRYRATFNYVVNHFGGDTPFITGLPSAYEQEFLFRLAVAF